MNREPMRHMRRQSRWPLIGLVPIAFGVLWLVAGWNAGIIPGLLGSVPGIVFTAAGAAWLLWPGDRQINHWLTLSALASIVLAIVLAWAFAFVLTLVLIVGGVVCFLLGGYMALRQDAVPLAMPQPEITLSLSVKAALDEGMLAFFMLCVTIPRGKAAVRDRVELGRLLSLIEREGWSERPEAMNPAPDAPKHVTSARVTARRQTFDWISFDSAYAPPDGIPGIARWQAWQANRHVHARIFCHAGEARPWLMCIHGYQMGTPGFDFSLFRIKHLHETLGLNLIMPILPLHGPRRVTRISGGQFLDGSLCHMVHAECQSLWDLRRCLAWLRTDRHAEVIGVLGYSLGGYNAALLAAFEPTLACVIAGIPLTDFPAVLWRHMPIVDRRYIEACGLRCEWVSRIMAPLSPLQLPARVPRERRYIFAACGDQLVPPEQPLALWRHWGEPAMYWYQGSHLSVRREPGVGAFVDRALRESGLVPQDDNARLCRLVATGAEEENEGDRSIKEAP